MFVLIFNCIIIMYRISVPICFLLKTRNGIVLIDIDKNVLITVCHQTVYWLQFNSSYLLSRLKMNCNEGEWTRVNFIWNQWEFYCMLYMLKCMECYRQSKKKIYWVQWNFIIKLLKNLILRQFTTFRDIFITFLWYFCCCSFSFILIYRIVFHMSDEWIIIIWNANIVITILAAPHWLISTCKWTNKRHLIRDNHHYFLSTSNHPCSVFVGKSLQVVSPVFILKRLHLCSSCQKRENKTEIKRRKKRAAPKWHKN